jgi:tRNA pseudouridine55 synthase
MKSARRALNGVLLLDKPAGLSSNTAVGWMKRLFNAAKAGHTGTLDPFATGLLPICFGESAKFARFQLDADKSYRATLKLGETSSTGDTEGDIMIRRAVHADDQRIDEVLRTFLGVRQQMPPMHSALKKDGVPLYKLARQGIEVEREARDVTVHAIRRVSFGAPLLVIDCTVSKGTYIRVLAEDIGEALGCGAHLVALRRTGTGHFTVPQSTAPEVIEALSMDQRVALLLPGDSLAMSLPAIELNARTAFAIANGQVPHRDTAFESDTLARLYGPDHAFLGVALAATKGGAPVWVAERMMGGADNVTPAAVEGSEIGQNP